MEINEALEAIIGESAYSKYAVGVTLGHGRNYIYNMLQKGSNPNFKPLVSIANLCGYDLALIKRDGSHTILLDPPKGE